MSKRKLLQVLSQDSNKIQGRLLPIKKLKRKDAGGSLPEAQIGLRNNYFQGSSEKPSWQDYMAVYNSAQNYKKWLEENKLFVHGSKTEYPVNGLKGDLGYSFRDKSHPRYNTTDMPVDPETGTSLRFPKGFPMETIGQEHNRIDAILASKPENWLWIAERRRQELERGYNPWTNKPIPNAPAMEQYFKPLNRYQFMQGDISPFVFETATLTDNGELKNYEGVENDFPQRPDDPTYGLFPRVDFRYGAPMQLFDTRIKPSRLMGRNMDPRNTEDDFGEAAAKSDLLGKMSNLEKYSRIDYDNKKKTEYGAPGGFPECPGCMQGNFYYDYDLPEDIPYITSNKAFDTNYVGQDNSDQPSGSYGSGTFYKYYPKGKKTDKPVFITADQYNAYKKQGMLEGQPEKRTGGSTRRLKKYQGRNSQVIAERSTTDVPVNKKLIDELVKVNDTYSTGDHYVAAYANKLKKDHNVDIEYEPSDPFFKLVDLVGSRSTAYYNPFTRTINYRGKFGYYDHDPKESPYIKIEGLLNEIPHAIQFDRHDNITDKLKEGYRAVSDLFTKDATDRYFDPNSFEGEAHEVIEPELRSKYQDAYNETFKDDIDPVERYLMKDKIVKLKPSYADGWKEYPATKFLPTVDLPTIVIKPKQKTGGPLTKHQVPPGQVKYQIPRLFGPNVDRLKYDIPLTIWDQPGDVVYINTKGKKGIPTSEFEERAAKHADSLDTNYFTQNAMALLSRYREEEANPGNYPYSKLKQDLRDEAADNQLNKLSSDVKPIKYVTYTDKQGHIIKIPIYKKPVINVGQQFYPTGGILEDISSTISNGAEWLGNLIPDPSTEVIKLGDDVQNWWNNLTAEGASFFNGTPPSQPAPKPQPSKESSKQPGTKSSSVSTGTNKKVVVNPPIKQKVSPVPQIVTAKPDTTSAAKPTPQITPAEDVPFRTNQTQNYKGNDQYAVTYEIKDQHGKWIKTSQANFEKTKKDWFKNKKQMGGLTKAQYGLIGPEEEQKPGVARVMGADEEGTPVLRPTTGYHLPEVEISAKAPDTYNNYIRNKYKDAGLGAVMFGMPLDYAFGFPQAAMTKAFTGKYQLPSEAMGIENPVGALLTDAALDPVNITGAGLLTKEKALAALAELKPYQNLNFRGITPVGYGARDKILNYIPNVLRYTPEKKLEDIMVAFEQGASTSRKHIKKIRNDVRRHMSLTDEQYRALPVDETKDMMSRTNFKNLEEQARKRVDSFRKGLGLEQQYGTFEPVGDNVFRIIDSDIEKGRFSTLWNDIRANDLKNKVYVGDNDPLVSLTEQHNKITDNKLYTPDSFYSINDLRNYLNKTGDVKFKPWKQTRIVENARNPEFKWSIYDADPKGIQGAFRWDVKKTNDGLLHFQANDTWDLHPWQTRGRINLEEDALDIANRNLNSKDLLKNIEALRLLGGKPFDIRNNYLVDPETMNIVKQWRKGGSLPKHQNGKLKVRLHKRQ